MNSAKHIAPSAHQRRLSSSSARAGSARSFTAPLSAVVGGDLLAPLEDQRERCLQRLRPPRGRASDQLRRADRRASLSACGTARPAAVRRRASCAGPPGPPRARRGRARTRPSTARLMAGSETPSESASALTERSCAVALERAQRLDLGEREVQLGDRVERADVRRAHQVGGQRVHVARERSPVCPSALARRQMLACSQLYLRRNRCSVSPSHSAAAAAGRRQLGRAARQRRPRSPLGRVEELADGRRSRRAPPRGARAPAAIGPRRGESAMLVRRPTTRSPRRSSSPAGGRRRTGAGRAGGGWACPCSSRRATVSWPT